MTRDRNDRSEKELVARLRRLPEEAPPSRDLWPELQKRIRDGAEREPLEFPGGRSVRLQETSPTQAPRWRKLATAAALLAALGLGAWLGRLGVASAPGPEVASGPDESVPLLTSSGLNPSLGNAISDAERALIVVKQDLRLSLDRYRDALPEETVRALDSNLETIERSISELRQAIEANPESGELRRALVAYHENEIALLKRVNRAASRL